MRPSVAERFWAKVEKTETHWLWKARLDRDGYGRFEIRGRLYPAHRVAYALVIGTLGFDEVLRHRCGRRDCVRPSHVLRGSQAENIADRDRDGTTARGSRNGRARVNELAVRSIRECAAAGVELRQLAEEHGLSLAAVGDIVRGRNWRHLHNAEGKPHAEER